MNSKALKWTCYLVWFRTFSAAVGAALLLLYFQKKLNLLDLGVVFALFASSLGLYFKRQRGFSFAIVLLVAYDLIHRIVLLYPWLSSQPLMVLIGPLFAIFFDVVLFVLAVLSLRVLLEKRAL